MVVIYRLRRRLFCYKFYFVTLCAFVITLMIYFRTFEISYNIVSTTNNDCPREPVDVVYTWVNGSDPEFLKNLNSFVVKGGNDSFDSSKQRYDDKYELKFSLRSLEKYAPWVNHIYIVTNGQIPYWLNLDYEKVTLVTHEEIFKDSSNLPTFSSPAIECNLHRIPGLSRKFIYFNDDIFLGQPTFFEDFYAPNKGFLVYLSWPVPQCSTHCPWMYVADGQCDKSCLNSDCQMDGGDCRDVDEKTSTFEGTTEDDDVLFSDDDVAKNQVLDDTIQRVRANFYNSFIKKLMPYRQTQSAAPVVTEKKKSYVLNIFTLNDMKNLSDFVNEHNKIILKKDKSKRDKVKRRKRSMRHSNRTLLDRLQPNVNIDAYSGSLQHTNRMLNSRYGFKTRKVPSHAPILVDIDIMEGLQRSFLREFAATERNRVRKKDDVQFSFSYYYFLMSETVQRSVDGVFNEFDTDSSSTWSDREIRTLLTKLYELPLSYAIVDHFEALLLNCSDSGKLSSAPTPLFERYIDSRLPTITKNLVTKCPSLRGILMQRFGAAPKYTYEVVQNAETKHVAFKMLNSNISDVVSHLDEIRSNRKKFICLNDNLDETKASENELVRAILYDFYTSLFPHPSKFELPEDFRNKFSYVYELNEWKRYRYNFKMLVYSLVLLLLCLTLYNLCKKKCCQIANKLFC